MEETRTVRDVVQDEILSERIQRYRRNVIVLSVIAIAIHGLDFVNFSKLNLFGLQVHNDKTNPRIVSLSVLWLLLAYNTAFFTYQAYWDWRQWVGKLTAFREKREYFPELQMFKGEKYGPKNQFAYSNPPETNSNLIPNWRCDETDKTITWTCHLREKNGTARGSYSHRLLKTLIHNVNEKKRYYYIFEIGIPTALLLTAIFLADRNIF